MKPPTLTNCLLVISCLTFFSLTAQTDHLMHFNGSTPTINIKSIPEEKKVEVWVNDQFFTAYFFPDNIAKPVLYPIFASNQIQITRGFPEAPVPGERVDHPHHIGLWLNYGNVNGLDFWNNSGAENPEKLDKFGVIHHQEIIKTQSGSGKGTLEIKAGWDDYKGKNLLEEITQFTFEAVGNDRIITRKTTLTAIEEVQMDDNKEGMIGIRVAKWLELPSNSPAYLVDQNGEKTKEKVINNEGVNGDYLSSEGISGGKVWGTRAKWMTLSAKKENIPVSIAILDHAQNVGYPTYWHARDYGLFAANPLGQAVFSKGEQEMHFALKKGTSVTFLYKIIIRSGAFFSKEELDKAEKVFSETR